MKATYLLFIIIVLIVVLVVLLILLVIFIVLVALIILVLTVILDIGGSLVFTLHAALSELLHHLQELLAVVLEEVVSDRQDVPYFRGVSSQCTGWHTTHYTCQSQSGCYQS